MRIMAVLTKGETVADTLDAAVLAAASVACSSIEALNVVVDSMHLVSTPEEIDIQELREYDEGSAQQRADAIQAAFSKWNTVPRRLGAPPLELRRITGAEAETVMREMTGDIELVVMSHNRNMDAADAFHAALFKARRPVLLVPPGWRSKECERFSHIAVGLTESELTRRAVELAGPWLGVATSVTGICISDDRAADEALRRMIEGRCPDTQIKRVERSGRSTGAQLVHEADSLKVDMLVTGAFSHAEWLEWLVGSETREVLAAADLPLLLVH